MEGLRDDSPLARRGLIGRPTSFRMWRKSLSPLTVSSCTPWSQYGPDQIVL